MNLKIKELAEQAGFYFYDLHDIDGQDMGETIEADSWEAAEKFAEMIVNEHLTVWERMDNGNSVEGYTDMEDYPKAILQHFGVK